MEEKIVVDFTYNGALYRFAYNWNPEWRKEETLRANICPLFWWSVFAVIAWPIHWLARLVGWVVRIVGFLPALLLFGYKPAPASWRISKEGSEKDALLLPFVPIESWPKFRDCTQMMPGICILLLGIFTGVLVVVFKLVMGAYNLVHYSYTQFSWFHWGVWVVLGLTVVLVATSVIRKTEIWQMIKSFVRAKKERYCFEVRFVKKEKK